MPLLLQDKRNVLIVNVSTQIQQMKAELAHIETLSPGGLGSEYPSRNPSRVGSPLPPHLSNLEAGLSTPAPTRVRYGDECFYGKVSLLHFIVFFFLGGITVLIVGAVQVTFFVLF